MKVEVAIVNVNAKVMFVFMLTFL